MPKTTITLNSFERGLDSKNAPRDLQKGFLSSATNVDVSSIGRITTLGSFNNDLDAQTNLSGIGNFQPGFGLFRINIDGPPEASGAAGEYLVHTDGNGEVNIGNKSVGFNAWNGADLGSVSTCKPVYYYADGGLRIADSVLGNASETIALQRLVRSANGYAALTERMDLINDGFAGPVNDDFEDSDSKDCVPADVNAEEGEEPAAGDDFLVQTLPSGTDGLWPASTYTFGASYVYYGNQESKISTGLTNISANGTITLTDGQFPNISVSIKDGQVKLAEIQGMRIYLRDINNPDDEFTMLLDIDFEQGSRISLADDFDPLVDAAAGGFDVTNDSKNVESDTRAYAIKQPGLDTYATINGYLSDEKEISFNGNAAYGYKTAVVANQRAFVANVVYADSESRVKQMGDRIQYSPVRKYDLFPQSFYLDIGTNDGDEIVKLQEFNDKLFVYKKDKLYIINIASGSDAGWYVEGEYLNRGVTSPAAVTKTDIGIMWANKDGLFAYDDSVRKLSGTIKDTDWNGTITDNAVVGFIPVKNQVIVIADASDETADGYIYDLETSSIVQIDSSSVLHNDKVSNLVIFDDKLCYMEEDGNTKHYNPAPAAQGNLNIVTKELDFELPSTDKKFYKVYITHIGGDNMQLYAAYNGASPVNGSIFTVDNFTDSSALTTQEFIITNPIAAKSITLRITDDDSNASQSDFEIQDISVNLRAKGQR